MEQKPTKDCAGVSQSRNELRAQVIEYHRADDGFVWR